MRHEVAPVEWIKGDPDVCPLSVPDPCVRRCQRRGTKPGVKAKARPSHPGTPAQGKQGRVNASEPLTRPRYTELPEADG